MAVREGIEQRAALTLLNQSVETRVDEVLEWYNQPEALGLGWLLRDSSSQHLRFRPFYDRVVWRVNQESQRYFPIRTKLGRAIKDAVVQALLHKGYHIEFDRRGGYLMVPNQEIGQNISNP